MRIIASLSSHSAVRCSYANVRSDRRCDRGITAVEAAILMPFFLTLVYGIIYLALYLSVQGILDTAATRALTAATTSADFDITESGLPACEQGSSEQFCLAMAALKTEIARLSSSAFVGQSEAEGGIAYLESGDNPTITWPAPSGEKSYEEVLQSNPITISVAAEIKTFVPFMPTMRVVGRAAGFREVRKALSYPVVTDCNGYPVGHPSYQQRPCSCTTPNSAWNPTRQACEVCDQGRSVPTINPTTGAMSAPPGFIIITPIPNIGRPPQFCACPDSNTCLTRHGGNATTFYHNCLCGCQSLGARGNYTLESDPSTETYEQCDPCPGIPPDYAPFGPSVRSFTGYTQTTGSDGRLVCRCDPALTDADCQAIFPPEMAGVIRADPNGCRCICAGTYCSPDGSGITNTPGPNSGPGDGSASVIWFNPGYDQCRCGCYLPDGQNSQNPDRHLSGGLCECNTPCAGGIRTRGRDDPCDEASCRCPADPPCGAGYVKNDADPACGCIPVAGDTGS